MEERFDLSEQDLQGLVDSIVSETTEASTEEPSGQEQTEEAQVEKGEQAQEVLDEVSISEDGVVTLNLEGAEQPVTESVEDIKKQLKAVMEELAEARKTPKLDPRIEKLNNYIQSGGEINESFWNLQSKDYTKVDTSSAESLYSILLDKLKYVDEFDKEDIQFYVEENFPIASGVETDPDEADRKREMFKLRQLVKENLPKLQEKQNAVMLPKVSQQQIQEQEKLINLYRAEAGAAVDEINTVEVTIDAENKLKFQLTPQQKSAIKMFVAEPENHARFVTNRYVKDGKIDYAKWVEESFILDNMPSFKKALLLQGKSAGKKEILAEIQGENGSRTVKKPNSEPQKDVVTSVLEQIKL